MARRRKSISAPQDLDLNDLIQKLSMEPDRLKVLLPTTIRYGNYILGMTLPNEVKPAVSIRLTASHPRFASQINTALKDLVNDRLDGIYINEVYLCVQKN